MTPAFLDTFRKAAQIANRAFQLMVGPAYGVRWLENYSLKGDGQTYFPELDTMLMEPNTFLPAVERDFFLQGGRVVVRKFQSRSQIAALLARRNVRAQQLVDERRSRNTSPHHRRPPSTFHFRLTLSLSRPIATRR